MSRVVAIAFVFVTLTPIARSGEPETRPLDEQPYIGLELRDIPGGHTVVSLIRPGPLAGTFHGSTTFDVARPDLIVSVDGSPTNAGAFCDYVRGKQPGDDLVIAYRRSNDRGGAIPSAPDHEQDVQTLTVTLDARDNWVGTIHRGRGLTAEVKLDGLPLLAPHEDGNLLGRALAEHGLREPVEKLCGVFRKWKDKGDDFHALSRVRAAFDSPFCLPELELLMTEPTQRAVDDPVGTAVRLMRENLDIPAPEVGSSLEPDAVDAKEAFAAALLNADKHLRLALGDAYGDDSFAQRCLTMLRVPHDTFYIRDQRAKDCVTVMKQSMQVDFGELAEALTALGELARLQFTPPAHTEAVELPAELRGAVTGDIAYARRLDSVGWIVIGGPGSNTYDLARVAGVLDPGGDDQYTASDLRLGCRAILDYAGNDLYTGSAEQGPGGALLGISLIDDRQGDDRYEGKLLASCAAMFGGSLLIDRAGHDQYTGEEWSIGAACYGAAVLVDLGGGNDLYVGDYLCQAVGGPRGFGGLIDENGRDFYRANGPSPSAYGMPAVFRSYCQGIGFGYREYAAGGIGLLSDLGGDDRYEAGEFAQGGGYYYGLGVLHDAGGRDLYVGAHYAQGFGVHQAAGILADDAGDDTYWAMVASAQGSGWDIGVGLLIDRAGSDSYQCDQRGQGGAANQAFAFLIDLDGVDRYASSHSSTQGRGRENNYHYHETEAFSFSLLMDLGGDQDYYSRGRPNSAVTTTGRRVENDLAQSDLHGLVIDE